MLYTPFSLGYTFEVHVSNGITQDYIMCQIKNLQRNALFVFIKIIMELNTFRTGVVGDYRFN